MGREADQDENQCDCRTAVVRAFGELRKRNMRRHAVCRRSGRPQGAAAGLDRVHRMAVTDVTEKICGHTRFLIDQSGNWPYVNVIEKHSQLK